MGIENYVAGNDLPYLIDVSAGLFSDQKGVNKFGENSDVGSGTTEDVWDGGGTITLPATALITKISQTANQATMTGKTVRVEGLASGFVYTLQDVTLDASDTTTPVTLTTPLMRVFRMEVQADVVTTSPIRCHNDAESVDYAIISTGMNQTLMAVYTVPAGKTAFLYRIHGDYIRDAVKDPDGIKFTLWASDRANEYAFKVKYRWGIPKQGVGVPRAFEPPIKFTEKTDIKISATASGADADVTASFDLILIDN